MHDLVISNALIVDGLGATPYRASLALKDGRIDAIGADCGAARQVIDADGLALAPGIIDNHTHYDAQITWDPLATPSPMLGVTTAVIGNCGFTIAPCKPADRELVMRNLTQVEGMSLEVLRSGIRWDFETFPQYLDSIERSGCAINIAAFVGHSSIRTWVMGAQAPRRAATPAEVAQMRDIVVDAMRSGAIGFSTTTSPAHNGEGGLPMPSRLADDAELASLAGSLKEAGRGVFMLTKGAHTRIAFLEEIAAASARPVVIAALLHNPTNPQVVFDDLEAIRAANARGHKLVGAVSCCPLTFDFTMQSPYPLEGMLSWKPALGVKGEAFKRVLADRGFRDGIRAELARPAAFRLFNGEWDKIRVIEAALPRNAHCEDRSLAAIAAAAGQDPLDTMLDLALAEDLRTVFAALTLNSDEAAVGRMLTHPHSMVSLSDAGAHLTFFNDAGFGLHLLGHWVRELGVLSLGEAVRRLSSHPAGVYGMRERGTLRPGYYADLMLFDPARVGRGPKQRVHDLPGGAPRLTTPALGLHGVWVNGQRIVDTHGMCADCGTPGKLLREFNA
jgi:N-acyl-D-aspartate/D-glutamate deacylase